MANLGQAINPPASNTKVGRLSLSRIRRKMLKQLRDIFRKMDDGIGEEDWHEIKSALNDLDVVIEQVEEILAIEAAQQSAPPDGQPVWPNSDDNPAIPQVS